MMCRGMWSRDWSHRPICVLGIFLLTTCAHTEDHAPYAKVSEARRTESPVTPVKPPPVTKTPTVTKVKPTPVAKVKSTAVAKVKSTAVEKVKPPRAAAPTPPCELAAPLKVPTRSKDVWWWSGDPKPKVTLSVSVKRAPCVLDVQSATPWVKFSLTKTHGQLDISLDLDVVPSGRYRVAAQIGSGGQRAQKLTFDVRVFGRAPTTRKRKVLVIGIDGVRPDALRTAKTPAIDFLTRRAAHSFNAHTQLKGKTRSGPGWASILTGVEVDRHRVDGNGDLGDRAIPTYLQRAKDALQLRTAVVSQWSPTKPKAHSHAYELIPSQQVPPFWQSPGRQSSISISQLCPPKPAPHSQA